MARKYKLIVFTRPVEGREDEYNDWYQNIHLAEVVDIPGIVAAQRFKLTADLTPGGGGFPYAAIYDLDTDDVMAAAQQLATRPAEGRMMISDALDNEGALAILYEELGEPVREKPADGPD